MKGEKMSDKLSWGLIGPGGIAHTIAHDFGLVGIHFEAVASRSLERATAFASKWGIAKPYGSYQQLLDDPEIDVVYISTPQSEHAPNAIAALNAGKHVLVEKPFCLNHREAQEMAGAAQRNGKFLMEAMWTRFLPHMVRISEILASGVIGKPYLLMADHNQSLPVEKAPRLHALELGGGALLDLGIYPVSFANQLFGEPNSVKASGRLTADKVDSLVSMIFDYPDGSQAALSTTMLTTGPTRAAVICSNGRIEIAQPWYAHTVFTVFDLEGQEIEKFEGSIEGRGMQFQALEVERCIQAELSESAVMKVSESVQIMHVLDTIRQQIGLVYSGD